MRAIWPTATVIALFLLILAAVRYPHVRVILLGVSVWLGLGAFIAVGWAAQRRKGWISIEGGEPLPEPERSAPPQRVVHQTPDHDAVPQLTACCDLPLPEVPPEDDWSCEPSEVTCTGGEG